VREGKGLTGAAGATRPAGQTAAEARLIKAISHPLRFRILGALNERPQSPARLSALLDEPLGNVSYHTRILEELDAIELVETRQVRGAIEHIYRAIARPWFSDEQWGKLPDSVRRRLADLALQGLWDHVVGGARAGALDEADIARVEFELDDQGETELAELLKRTLERALEIHAEAAGRAAEDGAERGRTELVLLHFHRAP
jgi:DNA-binding transcriptional ArsR family regulator